MNILPKARNKNILIQESGKEVLIYDLTTNKAFCLNETSASVFDACDGKTSFEKLKEKTNFTDGLIYLTLDALQKHELIDCERIDYFGNLSRREMIRKVGVASMIALPVITTMIAPKAAQAASGCINLDGAAPGTIVTGDASGTDGAAIFAAAVAEGLSKCCSNAENVSFQSHNCTIFGDGEFISCRYFIFCL